METEATTNTPSEQVETEVVSTEVESNAVETVTPESTYDTAYEKAFESMDPDNPDMSIFAEETNVEEEPEIPIVEDEILEDTPVNNDPFALDEDGYLTTVLKDRGKEARVTPEELIAFGNKGLNYEADKAEMKPFKPYMKILKENNVDVEDIKALADFVGGKKEALKHLLSKYEVDMYDVDTSEEQYTPEVEQYNSDPVGDIWSTYQQQDPDGSEVVAGVFNGMNEDFRKEVYNEKVFPAFVDDVKRGIFDELYPEAQKLKALHPGVSWIEAYSEANNRSIQRKQKTEVPTQVIPPKDLGTPGNPVTSAEEIWTDEGYKAMMEKMTI